MTNRHKSNAEQGTHNIRGSNLLQPLFDLTAEPLNVLVINLRGDVNCLVTRKYSKVCLLPSQEVFVAACGYQTPTPRQKCSCGVVTNEAEDAPSIPTRTSVDSFSSFSSGMTSKKSCGLHCGDRMRSNALFRSRQTNSGFEELQPYLRTTPSRFTM